MFWRLWFLNVLDGCVDILVLCGFGILVFDIPMYIHATYLTIYFHLFSKMCFDDLLFMVFYLDALRCTSCILVCVLWFLRWVLKWFTPC